MAELKQPSPPLRIRDIMVKDLYLIQPKMKIFEIVELLIRHGISGAPVVDNSGKILSIVGEGDVLRLAAREGLDAQIGSHLDKIVLTKNIVSLHEDSEFSEAYKIFLKYKFHRIPIVDGAGHLKGLIARSTILKIFIEAHYGKAITNHRP